MNRIVIFLSAAWIILAIGPVVLAQQLSVYQVGRGGNGVSSLTQFDGNGSLISQSSIPASESAVSATTYGGKLYVAENDGLINEYDLTGSYLGHFPNIALQAGDTSIEPNLESDSAGNIYEDFAGSGGARTSFRFDPSGAVSQTFSHPDLTYPGGIDAAANHDVYIANSIVAANRLFRFTAAGAFVASYPLPQSDFPNDLAIDEARNDLYLSDFGASAILKYDISSGTPVLLNTIQLPRWPMDVFVEPTTGDVFGLLFGTILGDTPSFRISQATGALSLFYSDADVPVAIVAIAVPEPAAASLIITILASCFATSRCRPTSHTRV